MTASQLIPPAIWILSVSAAFIIGQKMTSEPTETSAHESPRQSRHTATSTRNPSSSRITSTKTPGSRSHHSSSAQKLEISEITTSDNPLQRTRDLLELIDTLGPNDFQQVIADFRSLGMTRERMSEYSMLLHAWAKADPYSALDYASEHTGTPFARQTILTSWSAQDPESALSWARENHEGDSANPWLVGVIRGLAMSDVSRATEILHDLPYSRERGEALKAVIPHITSQGHDSATRWLNEIHDERLLTGATAAIASGLAKRNPEQTAQWVSTLDSAEAQNRAAASLAKEWSDQDISAAVAWTDQLSGTTKTSAAYEVMGNYAREYPNQAAGWLHSMSGEEKYQTLVQNYIWSTARNHPEASLAQISEIENSRNQNRYYERILGNWSHSNPEAAEAWMNNNQLPEGVKERIGRKR